MPAAIPGTVVASGAGVGPGGDIGSPGASGTSGVEVGSIKAWPSVTPPAMWMIMDGSPISRTLYPDLFTLIGTNFGAGDGSTTFNLPDARSRFILPAGQGSGLTNRILAATGGEENHQLIIAELAKHSHSSFYQANAAAGTAGTGVGSTGPSVPSGLTGGDTAHNNMPPFLVLTYIIKVSGGGGPTAQAPIANQTQAGLMNKLSGNATDYVGGDNACHALLPTCFFGTDTTNTTNYVVSVGSNFVLVPGVSVLVVPTNGAGNNPTLNVNGSGVINIVNRAGVQPSNGELPSNVLFGVTYDGTSWRLFTPIFRALYITIAAGAGGAVTVECAGYDGVSVYGSSASANGIGVTLSHLTPGVPVSVDVVNTYASATGYWINATNPNGTASSTYWIFANTRAGVAAVRIDSTSATTLTSNTHFFANGALNNANQLFLK